MKEMKRLCDTGVLEWQLSLRWALPTFIIPKKDSTVCTISDIRELNKRIVIWIIFLGVSSSIGQHVQIMFCKTCNILFVLNLHCAGLKTLYLTLP